MRINSSLLACAGLSFPAHDLQVFHCVDFESLVACVWVYDSRLENQLFIIIIFFSVHERTEFDELRISLVLGAGEIFCT